MFQFTPLTFNLFPFTIYVLFRYCYTVNYDNFYFILVFFIKKSRINRKYFQKIKKKKKKKKKLKSSSQLSHRRSEAKTKPQESYIKKNDMNGEHQTKPCFIKIPPRKCWSPISRPKISYKKPQISRPPSTSP
jgi:hypothetical protein